MPIDPQSGMFYGEDTAKQWLRDNEGKWDLFLHRHKAQDRPTLKKKMYEANPELSMSAVKDFFIPDDKKIERIKKFIENEWGIVLVCGGKDQGKCVSGDTEILSPDGSLRPISEIVQEKCANVLSLNTNLKIISEKPIAYIDMGKSRVLEVRTRTGRKIRVTPEHPFLTITGWKKCNDLRKGDRIAVPRQLPFFGSRTLPSYQIKILAYLLGEGHVKFGYRKSVVKFTNKDREILKDFIKSVELFSNIRTRIETRPNKTPTVHVVRAKKFPEFDILAVRTQCGIQIPIKRPIDKNLIKRLYLEGFSIKKISEILDIDTSTIFYQLKKMKIPIRTKKESSKLWPQFKNTVVEWLQKNGVKDNLSIQKEIPSIVFELSKENLVLFLNRLYACDGWACDNHLEIGYATSSEKMAQQIQHLLLRFSIITRIHKKKTSKNPAFCIIINDITMINQFIETIGDFDRKNMKKIIAKINRMSANPHIDTIPPEILPYIKKLKEERGKTWIEIATAMGYKCYSAKKSFFRTYSRSGGKPYSIGRKALGNIASCLDSKELADIANSDIFWDEITKIKDAGNVKVYDLTINPTHNFVANDIFVHNTATCWWVLETAKELGRKACVAGPPMKIPSWATRVMNPAAAPEGAIVYITEAAIQFSARSSMHGGQRDALSILPVIRHSDRLLLVETQHTRIVDINFLRLMDGAILKPGGMYREEERGPHAHVIDVLKPHLRTQTLFMIGQWFTLLKHQPLPECWSSNLSKSYKPIHDEKEALDFGVSLIEQDYSLTQVRSILLARSFNRPVWWWQEKMIQALGGPAEVPSEIPTPEITPAPLALSSGQPTSIVKRRLTKVVTDKNIPTTEMTDEQIKQTWGAD